MAAQTAFLSSTHHDLLTSLAFNSLSPHLLATSSLDGHIRIHARPQSNTSHGATDEGETAAGVPAWEEVAAFKAHSGPVLRVRWAEGEWGDLLASCGSDGSVRIWDQTFAPAPTGTSTTGPRAPNTKRWQQRACLIDARGSVRDIGFAPSDFGLHLATISADGFLRLYDCPDPSEGYASLSGQTTAANATGGLASWILLEALELDKLPMTATSSLGSTAGSSSFTSYGMSGIFLPGASSHTPGSAPTASVSSGSSGNMKGGGLHEADGGWALSWCKESWYGECLACASGGVVRILHLAAPSSCSQALVLQTGSSNRAAPVTTLDWAPGSGRSYQLVAAGFKDGVVRIWKIWPAPPGTAPGEGWRAELAADLQDHVGGGAIGKVEWNLTGTVLSTAGDDGRVRIWKASYSGEWRSVAVISAVDEPRDSELLNDGMR